LAVRTYVSADGQRVCSEVCVSQAPLSGKVVRILEPAAGEPEELSPLHFEWALAQETVKTQYNGSLTWQVEESRLCFVLELPFRGLP
jgi:hypothetical protein